MLPIHEESLKPCSPQVHEKNIRLRQKFNWGFGKTAGILGNEHVYSTYAHIISWSLDKRREVGTPLEGYPKAPRGHRCSDGEQASQMPSRAAGKLQD